jgi:hypothetical protein
MFAKKNSIDTFMVSFVRRPGVGASDGEHGGLCTPCNRFASFVERVVCLWVSRNSLITFALDPLGPFFCGIAWYVHDNWAEEQLRQGLTPSHFTFRRWQASQARFTEVGGAAPVEFVLEDDGVDEAIIVILQSCCCGHNTMLIGTNCTVFVKVWGILSFLEYGVLEYLFGPDRVEERRLNSNHFKMRGRSVMFLWCVSKRNH